MRRSVHSQSRLKLRGRKFSPFLAYLYLIWSRPVLLYGGIALVLLLVSLSHIQSNDVFRGRVWSALSPVFSGVTRPFVAVSSFLRNISSYQALQADSKLLTLENERLMEWYHTAQLLKAENQSLKSLLNVTSRSEYSFVTAQILSDPATPYAKSVLLNAGQEDGIEIGQAVIADTGLLGRIVDVQKSLSRVLLLTDINSRIPVMIEGTNQRGILVGHNTKNVLLDYIPENVSLEKGMSIVTSGDGEMLPVGLPIGHIEILDGKKIAVSLLSDYEKAHFVRILKKSEL